MTSATAVDRPGPTADRSVRMIVVGVMLAGAGGRVVADVITVVRSSSRDLMARLPDDAWYYLGIARNLGAGEGPTFDGRHRTNGYQPLWQGIEAVLASVLHGTALVKACLLVGMVMVVAATIIVVRVLRLPALGGALVVVVMACPPVWARCIDGMEAPAVLLAVAALVVAIDRWWGSGTPRAMAAIGGAAGLLVLARLSVAPFVVLLPWALVAARRRFGDASAPGSEAPSSLWANARAVATYAVAGIVVVAPWFVWSAALTGSAFPQGGALKYRWSRALVGDPWSGGAVRRSWGAVTEEVWRQVSYLVPFLGDPPTLVRRTIVVVAGVVAVWGLTSMVRRSSRVAVVVVVPLSLLVLRFLLEVVVQPAQVAPWYAAPMSLVTAVTFAVAAVETWRRWGASSGLRLVGSVRPVVVGIAVVALSGVILVRSDDRPDGDWGVANAEAATFARERLPGARVGAFDAGAVGWVLPGTVNLDGLVREPSFEGVTARASPSEVVLESGLEVVVGRFEDGDARLPECAVQIWAAPTVPRIAGRSQPVTVWDLAACR